MLCHNNKGAAACRSGFRISDKPLDVIGDDVGHEAAIVAQFALDLAVTAKFLTNPVDPVNVRQLLRQRLVRYRAQQTSPDADQSHRKASARQRLLLIQGGRNEP